MKRWNFTALALVLSGCGSNEPGTTDLLDNAATDLSPVGGDADTDADAECLSTIIAVTPQDGETGVDLDADVTVEFDTPVPATSDLAVSVLDTVGSLTVAADRLSATWTPTEELQVETEYTVDTFLCETPLTTTFTTVSAAVDPALFIGNAFSIPWDDITITEPGNSALLQAIVGIDTVLLQIQSVDADTGDAETAATVGSFVSDNMGTVNPICPGVVQDTADFSNNPEFLFGPQTISIPIGVGAVADVESFELQATVAADGQSLESVSIRGLLATDLIPGFDAECTSDIVALLLPTCLKCDTSPSGMCMLIEGNSTDAQLLATLDLYQACALL